ncbi:MAG: VWA domain-containing protein [Planctomycetes bacterium]|nr:VWA domain-containing protein [Planctomycetota bacterium]
MIAFLDAFDGLVWRAPAWGLAALAAPLLVVLRRRVGAPALRFAPAPLLLGEPDGDAAPLPRSWRVRTLGLPTALAVLGLVAAAVALARPAARVLSPVEAAGVDVVLCLDTSSSMAADDLERGRSRLDVAREAAIRFVRARPRDRLALVTFARYPDLRCPLTLDHRALEELLGDVALVTPDGPEDATGLGAAVVRSGELLRLRGAKARVVVLLTDGEENVATAGAPGEIAPVHAAQWCAREGVRVHAVAVGTGRRDAKGATVPLDPADLDVLASRTGGTRFSARDAAAVDAVYARIDALERTPFDASRARLEDRHLPWLLLAVALLVLARLLEAGPWAVRP